MKLLREYLAKNIEAHKPHFIEAFSHVYGQEHYEFIKNRINNTKVWVCHDEIDYVQLLQMEDRIKKHITSNKQEGIDAVASYIKLRKLYDNFNKFIYKELKSMFPTLVETNFPRAFISAFESFDKRLGKDSWKNRSILRERVKYFNYLGIDLGQDYFLYENNPDVKKLIPNKDLKKRFKKLCEDIYTKENYLMNLFKGNYLEIEEILTNELYDRKETKHKDMKGVNMSYCMSNSKGGEIAPVCLFNILNILDGSEMVYIHEFAHAIGISNLGKSTVYCDNKYRYLNEAIEDYSVLEIYDYMLEKGYTIFKENPSKSNNSIYRYIIPIGKAFVERFKDQMGSIRFGSKEELYNIIDENTLSELDAICEDILKTVETSKLFDKSNDVYIELLSKAAIKKIKEYKPNNKR